MAMVLSLKQGGTTVDLQGGTTGFQLVEWKAAVLTPTPGQKPDSVIEAMQVRVTGSSHDNLATYLQSLHAMQEGAIRYIKDQFEQNPVWLWSQTKSETGGRRALVRSIGIGWDSGWYGHGGETPDPLIIGNQALLTLTIEREAYWERTSNTTAATDTDVSAIGGVFDYSGTDVVGDAPARIHELKVGHDNGGLVFDECWLGFRSANKHGTLGNYNPIWELEDGINGADTLSAIDATASPGGGGDTKKTCTFAVEAGWKTRVTMALSNVSADESDHYGRFVCLLRAKVTAGTAEVRIRQLMLDDASSITSGPIVEISATDWTIYNLGVVTIPLRNLHAVTTTHVGDGYDSDYAIQIRARETATCDLYMDCLVMIPCDEYYIHGKNIDCRFSIDWYLCVSPEGQAFGVSIDAGDMTAISEIDCEGDGVPIGDGRLIGVFARANSEQAAITYDWDPSLELIPRWGSLRGSE